MYYFGGDLSSFLLPRDDFRRRMVAGAVRGNADLPAGSAGNVHINIGNFIPSQPQQPQARIDFARDFARYDGDSGDIYAQPDNPFRNPAFPRVREHSLRTFKEPNSKNPRRRRSDNLRTAVFAYVQHPARTPRNRGIVGISSAERALHYRLDDDVRFLLSDFLLLGLLPDSAMDIFVFARHNPWTICTKTS